jgi:GH18 family chitinase
LPGEAGSHQKLKPKQMKTRFIILLFCLLTAYTVSAQYTFPACYTAWAAGTYTQDQQVSHKSANWKAKYFTTAEPGTNGDWQLLSKCGDGGIGPDYTGPQRIIGYLPYWVPNFDYNAFDPGTCTHINIAFNLFKQNNNDFNSANFASIEWGTFHNRKVDSILFDLGVLNRAKAKGTKVSVAIGGATDYAFLWLMTKYYNNDAKLEEIANFITNYVNTKGIDGVDLDLECWWPDATIAGTTEQGGRVRGDKWGGIDAGPNPAGTGLKNLAQKLRAKMPNKVLSAAVFGTSYYGNNYDDGVAQYLDFLGLMTYDFTGSWNTSPVGPHSSLYKIPLTTPYQGISADNPIYSAQDALEYWMGMAEPAWNHDGGFAVQKNKLCIGVPFYGYDLATRKPNNANGFVALKWNEIVAAYPNAPTSFDPLDTHQLGGYINADNKKIYYETPKGAAAKINYTKQFGHQGVIVWELSGDTPYGGGKSLLKALNDAVGIVVNPAPTTSITSPANNATFTAPASVTINANASDTAPGTVTKVDFYNGTTLLGTDTSSPYSFAWANVAAGTYTLTTKATDNQGAVGTSSAITITVNGTNPAPTTSITSPANNATFTAPASVTINANAADTAPGTVAKVDFYNGTTLLGTDTSSPYSFSWTNVASGTYTLTTKATDNQGAVGTSSAITITVNGTNPAPTTSITSPANNATFTAPASVTINANASDTAPGTVAKVDFYNGTTLLGTDTSSPYSFSWTSVAAGTYTLTTKATDDQGAVGTSAAITITVNGANPAPTTSITSPANNATFTAPASVTINANASDTAPGTVAKVDFYNGTTLLGTDTSSPYSFSWTSVAAGTYTLTTKATDDQGAVGTSAAITIVVNAQGLPIPGTIQAENYCAMSGIQLETTTDTGAGQNVGWIDTGDWLDYCVNVATAGQYTVQYRVASLSGGGSAQLRLGATTLATTTIPSTGGWQTWTSVTSTTFNLAAGPQTLRVFAGTGGFNLNWMSFTSACGTPLTASITSPANGTTYTAPASIVINASANGCNAISKVDFYNGTTLLGTDTSSPYSFTWSNVAAGTYSITAKATDSQSATVTSSVISVTVNGTNPAPTTSITSPANGAAFTAPATINIAANAADTSPGTVAKVDFYNGTTLLGTDTSSPYTFSWTSVAAGTYTITTKATDNQGAVGTSTAVSVTVSGGTGCAGKAQYVENNGYVAGSQVQNVGSWYECKPYPYTAWCNGAAWAYAPGTGTYWADAWTLKGSCSARSAQTETEVPSFGSENEILVSPNPGASGRPNTVTIIFASDPGNVKIQLQSTSGISVMNSSHENVKRTLNVEIPALPNGLYILRVQGPKKNLTAKYMVD